MIDWAQRQAKQARQRAKKRWGKAWGLLSNDQRQGAIAQEIVNLIVAQDESLTSPLLKKLQRVAELAMMDEEP